MAGADQDRALAASHWAMPRFDAAAAEEPAGDAVAAEQAARELAAAHAAAEAEGRAQGWAEGHAAGHAEGLAAGLEEGRATAATELDTQLDAWGASVASLTTALQDARVGADDVLLDALAGLVAQVARAVLGRELSTGSEALRGVLTTALADLRDAAAPVQVQASPEALAMLREMGLPDGVELLADPQLTDGCRILQPGSVRDHLVSERFARLVDEALAVHGIPAPAADGAAQEQTP